MATCLMDSPKEFAISGITLKRLSKDRCFLFNLHKIPWEREVFPPVTYVYINSADQIENILIPDLDEYKKAFIGRKIQLGFDIESHWTDDSYKPSYNKDSAPLFIETSDGDLEGTDRLFSIGLDPTIKDRQYLIDTRFIGVNEIRHYFKDLFEKEAILIGQFLKYDLSCLARKYGIFPEDVRCTETIARKRYNGDKLTKTGQKADFKLATLYRKFLSDQIFLALTGMTFDAYELYKSRNQKSNWKRLRIHPSQLQYAADDVRLIFYLYKAELEEVGRFVKKYPKSGLVNNIKIECSALVELAIAETAGIESDVSYQENELIPYLEQKYKEAEQELSLIKECWIPRIEKKVRSKNKVKYVEEIHSSQLARFHYSPDLIQVLKNLGFNNFKATDKGNESCNKEAFNELFWRCPPGRVRDILEKIYNIRKAATFLSKNGENQLEFVHNDGRVHPTYFPLAAETSRMAAKDPAIMTVPSRDKMFNDPILDDQGVPVLDEKGKPRIKDAFTLFRKTYKASSGMDLFDADFSNEEVRVAGELAVDKVIIQAFKDDLDLHQITADNLGVDRETGKLFFLSTMYEAYENKIIQTLYEESGGRIDYAGRKDEVTELRNNHFSLYSGLAQAMKDAGEYVQSQLRPFQSLAEFSNRRPILVGFTPVFGDHRLWCLNAEQERISWKINKGDMEDIFHRDYKVLYERTGKVSTWANEWNSMVREITRQYWNFKVQGVCGTILKLSMIKCGREFRNQGWCPYKDAGLRIFVHDEIVGEARKEIVKQAGEILTESMLWALRKVLIKVPAKVSINYGANWAEASP